ncbi:MAG: OmpA family protein [Bacteroidetes bacterium]|nr:OmpA family protein [Bacteroidota bacterium]
MKNIFSVLLILTCLSLSLYAQEFIEQGDHQMSNFRFEKAAASYKKAADLNANDTAAMQKLGMALMMEEDYVSAEAVYKSIVANPNSAPINKFYLGQMLRINGKYDEAGKVYKNFALASPLDSRAIEFKKFAEDVKPLLTDLKTYEISNIPENSNASDIGPAYWIGGMIYASNRGEGSGIKISDLWSGRGYYDLYGIKPGTPGDVLPAEKLKRRINRRLNEGPATFSADGKEMFFTRTNYKKKGADHIRRLGLYHADWTEKKGWTNIQSLPFNSADYNAAHPALSKDGNRLYFISDMPNGFGETDVYVSVKNGTTWENPVNLGKEINTPGREMFPSIGYDGSLYFASDSRVGLGGLDIYSANASGNKFSNVQNVGAPLNTAQDDFGYVSDETGKNGFIVSNRPGGLGDDDIYKFVKKAESICGTVVDAKTKAGVPDVNLVAISSTGDSIKGKTNLKGDFCFNMNAGSIYQIEADKNGYGKSKNTINVSSSKNESEIILLEPKGGIDLIVDVSQQDGNKLQGATVFVIDKQTGEAMEQKSDVNGKTKFDLYTDHEYDLKVTKPLTTEDGSFDKFVKTISTADSAEAKPLNENVMLTYTISTLSFDLPSIYFDYNSWELNGAAKKELDKVAGIMKSNTALEVEMSSYTDSRGKAKYNYMLSAFRANACVEYLASNGVDKTHLIAIGFGEEKLKNSCTDKVECSDAEHSVNRRTEFKVVKFD